MSYYRSWNCQVKIKSQVGLRIGLGFRLGLGISIGDSYAVNRGVMTLSGEVQARDVQQSCLCVSCRGIRVFHIMPESLYPIFQGWLLFRSDRSVLYRCSQNGWVGIRGQIGLKLGSGLRLGLGMALLRLGLGPGLGLGLESQGSDWGQVLGQSQETVEQETEMQSYRVIKVRAGIRQGLRSDKSMPCHCTDQQETGFKDYVIGE